MGKTFRKEKTQARTPQNSKKEQSSFLRERECESFDSLDFEESLFENELGEYEEYY